MHSAAKAEPSLPPAPDPEAGFGIYVHWPFCAAKCPYCDFNSHVRRSVDHAAWRAALMADLDAQAPHTARLPVTSVFFGGGTPSLMAPDTVAALLDRISMHFDIDPAVEVTLEANPTSVETDKFRDFRAAGVSRVSLGVQALNDADLKALGRLHSAEEAIAAYDCARLLFDRVSFDLIYGRQNQSLAAWEAELNRALSLAVDHLSLYQLTIEAGTRFGDLAARGRLHGLPGADLGGDFYDLTYDLTGAAGFDAYEVSNFAKPGAQCRHNLTYWRYGPYLGIGPGAHGRRWNKAGIFGTEAVKSPETWLNGEPEARSEVTPVTEDAATEYLMMSLRLTEGSRLDRYGALGGGPLDRSIIDELIGQGLLWQNGQRIGTTPEGRKVLNALLARLLT